MEWLGQRLKVRPLAVGTILAAFGTALPESVVTFVAVVFGHSAEQKDIVSAPRWAGHWRWPPSRTASPE